MRFRPLLGALAIVVVAVALLAWQPWTGQLEGTVYFTACAGTEPAHPPPGYKSCNTTVAAGARVTATPATHGSATQTVADSSGRYHLRLLPGQYYLWGVTAGPHGFEGQHGLVPVSPNTTLHVDIQVALLAA
jgi:hypothetical protein